MPAAINPNRVSPSLKPIARHRSISVFHLSRLPVVETQPPAVAFFLRVPSDKAQSL
ncbi:hypothetical protein IC582_024650 [Cucumis melo]